MSLRWSVKRALLRRLTKPVPGERRFAVLPDGEALDRPTDLLNLSIAHVFGDYHESRRERINRRLFIWALRI